MPENTYKPAQTNVTVRDGGGDMLPMPMCCRLTLLLLLSAYDAAADIDSDDARRNEETEEDDDADRRNPKVRS